MAEPIVLEFDRTRDEIKGLFASRAQHIQASVSAVVLILAGIAAFIVGNANGQGGLSGLGVFGFLLGALSIFGMTRAPKVRQRMADRLTGPTKVQLSDRGVEYSGPTVAERVEWSRMMRVLDRPRCWVLMTKAPMATYFIPKDAVPAEHQQAFAAQLAGWAGSAYKIRKR